MERADGFRRVFAGPALEVAALRNRDHQFLMLKRLLRIEHRPEPHQAIDIEVVVGDGFGVAPERVGSRGTQVVEDDLSAGVRLQRFGRRRARPMAEREHRRSVRKAIDDDIGNAFEFGAIRNVTHGIPPDCTRAALK